MVYGRRVVCCGDVSCLITPLLYGTILSHYSSCNVYVTLILPSSLIIADFALYIAVCVLPGMSVAYICVCKHHHHQQQHLIAVLSSNSRSSREGPKSTGVMGVALYSRHSI